MLKDLLTVLCTMLFLPFSYCADSYVLPLCKLSYDSFQLLARAESVKSLSLLISLSGWDFHN